MAFLSNVSNAVLINPARYILSDLEDSLIDSTSQLLLAIRCLPASATFPFSAGDPWLRKRRVTGKGATVWSHWVEKP